MISAKEKAKELVDRFSFRIKTTECISNNSKNAKECALIAVDEILESNMTNLHLHQIDYWEEVKQEIKLL